MTVLCVPPDLAAVRVSAGADQPRLQERNQRLSLIASDPRRAVAHGGGHEPNRLTGRSRHDFNYARQLARDGIRAPEGQRLPTAKGGVDCCQNVRRRLLVKAIERANRQLVAEGIDAIEDVGLHGLRRTFATLRCAVGDDPAYTASQLGHTDPTFTLRVYTGATKRRDRLTGAERRAYIQACE